MAETISDEDTRRVQDALTLLAEHFDTVRIFVTKHGDDDRTAQYVVGRGNFYAQLGQIMEWLSIQNQYQRNWAIRKDAEDT